MNVEPSGGWPSEVLRWVVAVRGRRRHAFVEEAVEASAAVVLSKC